MKKPSIIQKIIIFITKMMTSMSARKDYYERQREQNIEINEIIDWAKNESYYGNGKQF